MKVPTLHCGTSPHPSACAVDKVESLREGLVLPAQEDFVDGRQMLYYIIFTPTYSCSR